MDIVQRATIRLAALACCCGVSTSSSPYPYSSKDHWRYLGFESDKDCLKVILLLCDSDSEYAFLKDEDGISYFGFNELAAAKLIHWVCCQEERFNLLSLQNQNLRKI